MILFSHCLLFQKIYNKVNLLACWMSNQNTLNVTTNKTNVLLYSSFNEKSTTLQYSDPNTSVHKTQQQSTKVLNFEKFFFLKSDYYISSCSSTISFSCVFLFCDYCNINTMLTSFNFNLA